MQISLFTVRILNFILKYVLKYNNLGLSRNVSFCIPNIVDGAKTVAILFDPVLLSEIEVLKTAGGLGGFEFARLGRDTPRPLDYGLLSFQDQPADPGPPRLLYNRLLSQKNRRSPRSSGQIPKGH